MNSAWTYIIANAAVAALGTLTAVAWPNVVGTQAAPIVIAALAAANVIAHSIAGPGPASGSTSK